MQERLLLETEIRATFKLAPIADEKEMTAEEAQYLDDMNTAADLISEQLQSTFQHLVIAMMRNIHKI